MPKFKDMQMLFNGDPIVGIADGDDVFIPPWKPLRYRGRPGVIFLQVRVIGGDGIIQVPLEEATFFAHLPPELTREKLVGTLLQVKLDDGKHVTSGEIVAVSAFSMFPLTPGQEPEADA